MHCLELTIRQKVFFGAQVIDAPWSFSGTDFLPVHHYYKAGPATNDNVKRRIAEPSARSCNNKGSWCVAGNGVFG